MLERSVNELSEVSNGVGGGIMEPVCSKDTDRSIGISEDRGNT
jgi:hypothetical protein